MNEMHGVLNEGMANTAISCKDEYAKSIKLVMSKVESMFLFCITMEPVYARMRAVVGDEGVMYTYCDDSYILAPAEQMATTLQQAPGIFAKVGLRLGYGPGKTELIFPKGCSRQDFPFPLDNPDVAAPQVVAGFKSCLEVPRHFEKDPEFLHEAL